MNQKLRLVTQSGNVADIYSLIHADPYILQNFDVLPFTNTPLHEASSNGKIDLAMELMILKPSFVKKLNADGFSPLHLAVENQRVELALELVKFDPSLVRIRGRGGMTPMHLLAQKGGVDLLTEFLVACPESIRDANVNGETAIHITVMNNRYEELKVLTGWMQRMRKSDATSTEFHVLNRCDREGNTALHLAAYDNNQEAIKQLLKCMSLNRNIQNNSGMTALDVLRTNGPNMHIDTEKILQKAGTKSAASLSEVKTMSVFLREQVTFLDYCATGMARYRSHMSDGTRNSLLVITALIITATYQTAAEMEDLKYPKDGPPRIKDLIYITVKIVLIWGFNTLAFLVSIALTFILLPVGRAYNWWYMFITAPLVFSYAISIYMKSAESYLRRYFIRMYLSVLLGFLVYLLVFYVRWKQTKQTKVPEPKSVLISQDM